MSKELDELKLQMEQMQKKIKELENKEKEQIVDEWWTPKFGEDYWYIDCENSCIIINNNTDFRIDRKYDRIIKLLQNKRASRKKSL